MKDSKISLTWKPPINDGGSSITNYVLELRPEGAFKWSKVTESAITDTKFTAKGLKEDQQYEFHVAAENRAGIGPFSDPSPLIKPKEPIGNTHRISYTYNLRT